MKFGSEFRDRPLSDAYGTLIASNTTPSTVYLFSGQQSDPVLGLLYLRQRYDITTLGRFLTMDSVPGNSQDPLSLHKYLYVADNPVNRIDPSGHDGTVGELLGVAFIQGTIGAAVSSSIDYAVHRSFQHAAKAAGWGFVIGAATGATFQGIKAILVARGAAQALGVTVTAASSELITATTDGYLLGVITREGTIQLFKSGPGVFVNGVEILGHPDLIRAGLVAAGDAEGFSIAVQAGQVTKIFVNSALNTAERGFVLATEKTAAIIDALGAQGAQIFGY